MTLTAKVQDVISSFDTDVVIVGAGPVGLTLAAALVHHGVAFRILEKRTDASKNSKANNLWARTQELIDALGFLPHMQEEAYRIGRINVILNDAPLDVVPVGQVDSPHPEPLYTGQDVIETKLSEVVERSGVSVERGCEVVSVEQDADGATVTWRASSDENDEPGVLQTLRARYVVGADGAHGMVRKEIGLDIKIDDFSDRGSRQIDAKLSWRRSLSPDQLWFFTFHHGFAGVMPVWGGYYRIFIIEEQDNVPDRDPTLEEMQARAREVTGDATLTLADPIWFSRHGFEHGTNSSYRKDRVFLVGDAGHEALPIGGQGMNQGMHDATGLGWRLAMALADRAGPDILESYDVERHGMHVALDKQQSDGMKRLLYRSKLSDAALDLAADLIPNLGSLIFGVDDLQQLSTAYPDSTLSEDHLRQPLTSGVKHSGARAPDAEVTTRDHRTTTLFKCIYNPDDQSWGWSLLAFDGRETEAAQAALDAVARVRGYNWVRPRLVLAAPGSAGFDGGSVTTLWDLDLAAHAAYGLSATPALVLVRPDGHIAFRGPLAKPGLLESYCQRVFTVPSGGRAVREEAA